MNNEKGVWTIGIAIDSKEDYDRLMNEYSETSMMGLALDFKGLFQGYPEQDQYPCLVQYLVDHEPLSVFYTSQLRRIIDGGYRIVIHKGD